jgi:hypothetical protein
LFFEIIFIDSVNVRLWGRDRFLEENLGRGPKKIENHCTKYNPHTGGAVISDWNNCSRRERKILRASGR